MLGLPPLSERRVLACFSCEVCDSVLAAAVNARDLTAFSLRVLVLFVARSLILRARHELTAA